MGSAALPGRCGQGGADRGHQAGVGVAGDQRDPGQAAGDQVAEERQPAGPVLGGGDLDAQDLSVALGVDAGGDQGVHPDDAACLAHLEHQGVGGEEGIRAGIERAGPKRLYGFVELFGHDRHLRLGKLCHTKCFDQALHPASGYSQQVAGRHHAGQCAFSSLAALQQPVREIAALAQLGDRDVDGCGTGVEITVAVAVALIGPLIAAFAVARPAQGVGFSPHQGGDERREQPAQQIRARLCELVSQKLLGVDKMRRGHCVISFD
ncbi:hypothetical protein A4260_11025 [Streptococcus pneumoniae]|nr:hypothetical protein A4260_11025 [Streptococcus pneumoniae]